MKPSDYIDADYLPNGITLSDPRSMKLEDTVKLFQHIASRESSHGVRNAFRFKKVLSSRKKGSLNDAKYKDREADADQPGSASEEPKRRQRLSRPKARVPITPANVDQSPERGQASTHPTASGPETIVSSLRQLPDPSVVDQSPERGQASTHPTASGPETIASSSRQLPDPSVEEDETGHADRRKSPRHRKAQMPATPVSSPVVDDHAVDRRKSPRHVKAQMPATPVSSRKGNRRN